METSVDVYVRFNERRRDVLEDFLNGHLPNWRADSAWGDAEPISEALARAFDDQAAFARYGRNGVDAFQMLAVGSCLHWMHNCRSACWTAGTAIGRSAPRCYCP